LANDNDNDNDNESIPVCHPTPKSWVLKITHSVCRTRFSFPYCFSGEDLQ